MSLTIEQILAAEDLPVEEIKIPEWGGTVFVRRMTASDSIEHTIAIRKIEGDDSESIKRRLGMNVAAFLCDEIGRPIATADQARKLIDKSAAAINRIVEAGQRLNVTGDKEVAALSKNSDPSPDDTSPTA